MTKFTSTIQRRRKIKIKNDKWNSNPKKTKHNKNHNYKLNKN